MKVEASRMAAMLLAMAALASCASTSRSTPVSSPGGASPDTTKKAPAAPSTAAPSTAGSSSAPTPVPEVRPGVLAGYLPAGTAPDSAALLPPPPADDSAAKAADVEAYRSVHALRGTARWELATQDANLMFPAAAGTFSCALGVAVTEADTPRLYVLLRRTIADAGAAAGPAKRKYQRRRPFVELEEGSCSPADEGYLRNDGSYPSGHASIGWTWALLLAELSPDHDDAILARGLAYSQSRVVCGVHWQSDVRAGQVVGAGVVARLHGDPGFRADFEAAKTELAAARAKSTPPARDCAAEAVALALGKP